MNESKQNHHTHGESENDTMQKMHRPYWKRAHHDWRVWVGLFFMLAAITIYVMSNDLSFFPRGQPRQPVSGARGK